MFYFFRGFNVEHVQTWLISWAEFYLLDMNDLMENTITIAISNQRAEGYHPKTWFFSKSGESLSKALIMFTRLLYFEYINNVARECSFFF